MTSFTQYIVLIVLASSIRSVHQSILFTEIVLILIVFKKILIFISYSTTKLSVLDKHRH